MVLMDKFNRKITYLRISVTDRCNLNCFYCKPRREVSLFPKEEILSYEEIIKIVKIARQLGIIHFRITGGEPLLRRDIVYFLKEISKLKIDFSLTTNGIYLLEYAEKLKSIGLKRINVSLDTLDVKKYELVTGYPYLHKVLEGIKLARELGFSPIKINTVIMKGVNNNEIDNFIIWAKENSLNIRFIEFMPFTRKDYFFPLLPILKELLNKKAIFPINLPGAGPAYNFGFKDSTGDISFILPMSLPFCRFCNRIRLSADGFLYNCLFSKEGINIKKSIENQKELKHLFKESVRLKPFSYISKFLKSKTSSCAGLYKIGG